MKSRSIILITALLLVGCSSDKPQISKSDELPGSFTAKQIRYMTPFDMLHTLKAVYGVSSLVVTSCQRISNENRGIVGDSTAASGSPIFSEPNAGFVRWYVECVRSYAEHFQRSSPTEFNGPVLTALIAKGSTSQSQAFSKISAQNQLKIVEDQIERLIGPSEVIEDFGAFKSSHDLAKFILESLPSPDSEVGKVLVDINIAIAIRDEFLSY